MRLLLACPVLCLLASCFDPEIEVGLRCGPGGECPAGQSCVAANGGGICQIAGGGNEPDADLRTLSFMERTPIGVGAGATRLLVSELDGTAVFPDLVVAAGQMFGEAKVIVLGGQGNGEFAVSAQLPAGEQARSIAVGQIDGEFGPDIVYVQDVAGQLHTQELVIARNTNLVNDYSSQVVPLVGGGFWLDVHIIELSGDGRPDLLLSSPTEEVLAVFEQGTDGSFGRVPDINATAELTELVVADIDQDGREDLVYGGASGVFWSKQVEPPGQFLQEHLSFNGSEQVLVADMDFDGTLDVVSSESVGGPPALEILFQTGTAGSFGAALPVQELSISPRLALADFNQDSRLDVVSMTGPIALARVPEVVGFDANDSVPIDMMGSHVDVVSADFNNDGTPDVALLDQGVASAESQVQIYLQDR